MLIGDLPIGYNPVKSDIIVFSKDGVHLLKIRYDEFVKNVGITVPTVYYEDHTVGEVNEVGVLKVGENDYSINVPAGGGGGGADILVSTTPPQDNQGANGDLYFVKDSGQKFKYVKLSISKNKGNNTYTQITEFQFVGSNNKAYIWTGTRSWTNQKHHTMTDGPEAMLDGIINASSKALWECNPTSANTIEVILECFEPIDLSVYSKVQFITGGDAEARDPASWVISVSNDKLNWTTINSETNYSMTSTRLAVGYEATVSLPQSSQTFIKQRYFKESGHWIPILD